MNLSIQIVLRQSPNWGEMSDEAFRAQSEEFCRLIGRPHDQVYRTATLWNDTFAVDFLTMRQRIKEISLNNFRSVQGATLQTVAAESGGGAADGVAYIFVDDDDWLHPDLAEMLVAPRREAFRFGCPAIVWTSGAFGVPGQPVFHRRVNDGTCYTNNYAVIPGLITNKVGWVDRVCQHFDAERTLQESGAIRHHELCSIANKHPLSTMRLESLLKAGFSGEILRRGVEQFVERCEQIDHFLDGDVQWARPMMLEMRKLFGALL